jgi:hypothetical protein
MAGEIADTPKSGPMKVLQDNSRSLMQGINARFQLLCVESHIGIMLAERWEDAPTGLAEACGCVAMVYVCVVVVVASGHASEVGETRRDILQVWVGGRGQSRDQEGERARTERETARARCCKIQKKWEKGRARRNHDML